MAGLKAAAAWFTTLLRPAVVASRLDAALFRCVALVPVCCAAVFWSSDAVFRLSAVTEYFLAAAENSSCENDTPVVLSA